MHEGNIENLLAGPDKEQRAVEAHEATQNRFADQETQVGKAGPYTEKTTWRHSQESPRVESPRQMGQGETDEDMAKNSARTGQRS